MELCCKCGIRPRRSDSTHNGSYCRPCRADCQRAYAKRTKYKDAKLRYKRTRQFIVEAKAKPCADCHQIFPWYVMDFDHVRGKKKFNLSVAAHKRIGKAAILVEIAKCDVVCANCHRQRTFEKTIRPRGPVGKMLGSDPRDESSNLSEAAKFVPVAEQDHAPVS